ncbi:aldehyde dehydrogenase [Maribacter sp. 2307ULW6-5]|uniref:aldehyde dehydrogenase n=1 Tax=Maribacter sp. 2307ULW6-5 TaxID=3386275 RepID=UPI0039BD341A
MQQLEQQRIFFKNQNTKDLGFRKKALKRLQEEIVAREDAICDALYADFKKPKFETLAAETQFVLAEIKNTLKKLHYWAAPERVHGSLMNWPSSDYIYKEPYGNVLIIAPWNYPFQLALAPLIAAVAAGNTAIVKPSEVTPHTANIIEAIIKASFDAAHVAVVQGGVDTSQALLAQKWDYIFFTGSTRVGKIVYESAAKHLTPVTLELGGKNPTIVDGTAAIAKAAKRIVWGKFLNAGQTCIATDYILVHRSVKEQLIAELKKSITAAYGEDASNSNDYARTVSAEHFGGLKEMLQGEEILFGGQTDATDNFVAPTLVNEPKWDSKLMEGEIFGPILPIISYEKEEDLTPYLERYGKPLATYVFSTRKSFQKKIIENHSFGGGAINDTVIQITNKRLPFGGVGNSGIGAYHGKRSFDLFSHHKSIVKKANWFEAPVRYPPYTLPMGIIKRIKHLF